MKKLIYVTTLFVISLTANAQCERYETTIAASCEGFCAAAVMEFTPSLEVNSKLLSMSDNTMLGPLNRTEEAAVLEYIENEIF